MSLAEDLLHQARFLAELNPASTPAQVDLRRAVSSAYYAVFHMLSNDAAAQVTGGLAIELQIKTQRALNHSDMYATAGFFARSGRDKLEEKAIALPTAISSVLADIADGFRTLQEERHRADYDVQASFDRIKTLELVTMAEKLFVDWQMEKETENAKVFLASLMFWKAWRK